MTIRRPIISALCLASFSLALTTGCDDGSGGSDGIVAANDFVLEDWTDYIETPANEDAEPTEQLCENSGAAALCLDGQSVAFCSVYNETFDFEFGVCIPHEELECVPGDMKLVDAPCGEVEVSCGLRDGAPGWNEAVCDQGGDTPLVLRFDETPIMMIDASASPSATFDIAMSGDPSSCISTDWPTAATPWLAVDLDHSGTIDGGHELFGSGTDLADGKASNGFLALASYDENGDGLVDARDPRFAELVLWRDHDADRQATPGELETLLDAGVDSLSTGYAIDRQCDARGNCGIERAGFHHAAGSGEIVDLHLPCR